MSEIAPILFVSPARNVNSTPPNLLMFPPRMVDVSEVIAMQLFWCHGITLVITNTDEAAVRVGPPDTGIVGYTTVDHALAFCAAVFTEFNRKLVEDDEKYNHNRRASRW